MKPVRSNSSPLTGRCFPWFSIFFLLVCVFINQTLLGAQIQSPVDISLGDRALRFLQMRDYSVRIVAVGSILIGISCGMMGSFVVTRRLSLFGDTLSHAVLPGIAIGFLWVEAKDNLALLIGASMAGFLGVACITLLKKFSKVRQDSALGLVLSGFYAIGICILTRIQKMEFGNQAGLDTYLFGQVSSLSESDLWGICISLALIVLFMTSNHRELLVSGFDLEFSKSMGLPSEAIQYAMWGLLAFCVISSLQVIGVILASALLIIPAASASLLAKRMSNYILISALLGAIAGFVGAFLSFLGQRIPTGPLIVMVATTFFLLILFLRPSQGIIVNWLQSRRQSRQIELENMLKAIYQVMEKQEFSEPAVRLEEVTRRRGVGNDSRAKEIESLIDSGYVSRSYEKNKFAKLPHEQFISLTPKGWENACRIVRNHRLWELYLTNEARYAADHVHEDAEKIEHVLGEETVRKIERLLSNPKKDPHGKLIPSVVDVRKGWLPEFPLSKNE